MTVEFSRNSDFGYLEVIARAPVVHKQFLSEVIDLVEQKLAQLQEPISRILLVVDAAAARMSVFDSFEVWEQATARGLRAFRVAYVVIGRPINMHARLVQSVAQRHGIALRFFEDRMSAVAWLTAEAEP